MYNYYQNMMFSGRFGWLYFFVLLDLILKGIALYKSAGRKQVVWFVALLLVNSMGILPTIYLVIHKDVFVGTSPKVVVKKSTKRKK
ncbi:hypothetical protein A3K29_02355 [Candidatus Collierbacteria bacterium RIFOXYB2_FULL_46_14]|uniref:DUF5652 domain-containing protein n=1 Tax=Candidatus Collierbacteria bacterium GW2011_GWA2_46_26 TaxID=1618381 RepID=A0A0G1PIB0_9BACT|nr:MAG: hypothetical protein UW29_C0010G0022 [Candidatus Collierbacteria bacterium GW2011_GWC2_44_13]KKU32506.1 MAG: hypothetical protein UX47_C0010G0022 [Candidatus Collierbacteria bacterium GW2011_GWA2_46_26]OGD72965.1 MAG: hypothetical protein A3K29_02355 [Candidatus Collierbacteria bacterium RIFOXYB2_FULL_46_14]OGD76007.1 MAG: hypothetical protein A3K43_02355 [Candidatus Collierbacteria bacterium RIFOXYA2_FULL_46_20]OGD77343.1 MAG: hypothetical protein A3K39_02355 [Candidatus Collierbacteri